MLLLLALLQLMDSFKLVRRAAVLTAIAAGALAAGACLLIHGALLERVDIAPAVFSRYVAPITEEICKAAFIVLLLWRHRIGFLVDAAVQGFAVGAGFALVENVDYLRHLDNPSAVLWLARGLGSAMLHGGTTAMFAIVAKTLVDRRADRDARGVVPALALAVGVHSAFNHLPLPPIGMAMVLLVVLPLLLVVVFERSERATREWVGAGLDLDLQLLELVRSEIFVHTRFGQYLRELAQRFPGPVVADMFCLLRLEIELSIQAKAMLMAREAGLEVPVTEELSHTLAEIDYLRASIGRTGLLALKPLQVTSGRDLWHRHLLGGGVARTG